MVAQTISSEITAAGQAGNGYSATFLLPPGLSILKYNVSITKYGSVIVSTRQAGQLVQAVAFSGQQSLLSNSSYLVPPANTYYDIPTYNGLGSITIQNSQGTVCIDYSCPSTANQVSQMTLSSQTTGVVQFSGLTPGITVPNMNFNVIGNSYTLCAWVDIPSYQPSSYGEVLVAPQYANSGLVASNISHSRYQIGSYLGGNSNPQGSAAYGTWNFFCAVYAGAGSTLRTDYINGNSVGTDSSGSLVNIINAPLYIGNSGYTCCGDTTNPPDYEANAQMYGNALSANSIKLLYSEGINGAPLTSVSANIIGWWPLNGNAKDYSGYGNNGATTGPVTYPAVAQLSSLITNSTGSGIVGGLVGFSSSLGNFTAGPSVSNFTNSAGTATAFVTQVASSGSGTVTATAFNGNSLTSNSLVGWWPLNERQGDKVYDISPLSSNSATYAPGNIFDASWVSPKYVTQFNGQNSYLLIPQSSSFNAITTNGAFTVSMWYYMNAYPTSWADLFSFMNINDAGVQTDNSGQLYFRVPVSGARTLVATLAATYNPIGRWTDLVFTATGSSFAIYENGAQVSSGTFTGPISLSGHSLTGLYINDGNGGTTFWSGAASDVQIYSAALSAAQVSSLYQEGISGAPITSSNLIGWWPLNGDTLDYSGNGNNATSFGGVLPMRYGINQSSSTQLLAAQFNGINSYISTSLQPSAVGTPVTISGWIYPPNNPSSYMGYFGWRFTDSTAGSGDFYALQLSGTNLLELRFQNSAGTQYSYESGNNVAVTPNTWNLVSFTYDGSKITAYVNGVSFASIPASGTFGSGTSSPFTIGAQNNTGSIVNNFGGAESNIQVYSSSLSQSQIIQLYREGVSGFPISGAKLAGWWPLNGDTNDYSDSINNGVPTNVVYNAIRLNSPGKSQSMSGYGLLFNGQSSYVGLPQINQEGGTNSISYVVWFNELSLPSSWPMIFGDTGAVSRNGYDLYVGASGSSEPNYLTLERFAGGSSSGVLYSANPVSSDTWYFAVVTYDGNDLRLYLNGVLQSTAAASGSISVNSPMYLGALSGNQDYGNYEVADFQVYNSALNAQQVSQLYNAGMPQTRSISVPLGVT